MSQPLHSIEPPSANKAGDLTKVMRAAARSGPKVLRIGVVNAGHVVEERIIKDRNSVTVGANEKNLFVIKGEEAPSRFVLFERIDERYHLNFTSSMVGRVAQPGGTTELQELKRTATKTSQGYRVALNEDVRGKITIGSTTLLFQFVAPPPEQPRPRLPASVLRDAMGVDWITSIVAGVSFLAHFLAVGLLYSDWLDPVVDTGLDVRTLVENVKNLPPPPEIEEKPEQEDPKDKPDEKKEEKVEVAEKKPLKTPTEKTKLSSAEVATLSNELDSIDLDILATNNGMTATSNVLSLSESSSFAAMDRAAESGGGVSSGGLGLNLNPAGGAIAIGEAGNGLQDVGSKGKTVEQTSGKTAAVEGPKGKASIGGTNVSGRVADASAVVARMTAGVRACYNRGLASNPDLAGRVELNLQIGPGGEVQSVGASASGNLSGDVVDCIKSRARALRFNPPEAGQAVVSTSYTFVKQ
jgi:hypothetical protein